MVSILKRKEKRSEQILNRVLEKLPEIISPLEETEWYHPTHIITEKEYKALVPKHRTKLINEVKKRIKKYEEVVKKLTKLEEDIRNLYSEITEVYRSPIETIEHPYELIEEEKRFWFPFVNEEYQKYKEILKEVYKKERDILEKGYKILRECRKKLKTGKNKIEKLNRLIKKYSNLIKKYPQLRNRFSEEYLIDEYLIDKEKRKALQKYIHINIKEVKEKLKKLEKYFEEKNKIIELKKEALLALRAKAYNKAGELIEKYFNSAFPFLPQNIKIVHPDYPLYHGIMPFKEKDWMVNESQTLINAKGMLNKIKSILTNGLLPNEKRKIHPFSDIELRGIYFTDRIEKSYGPVAIEVDPKEIKEPILMGETPSGKEYVVFSEGLKKGIKKVIVKSPEFYELIPWLRKEGINVEPLDKELVEIKSGDPFYSAQIPKYVLKISDPKIRYEEMIYYAKEKIDKGQFQEAYTTLKYAYEKGKTWLKGKERKDLNKKIKEISSELYNKVKKEKGVSEKLKKKIENFKTSI